MSELRVDPMLDFDPDALRDKYRLERDKRLRDDGNDQYTEAKGDFAHYIDDPYIESPTLREPLTDEIDMVIIGGGFGGLLAGARLREAGIENIWMMRVLCRDWRLASAQFTVKSDRDCC